MPVSEPNFMIVGAARSATTALYHALDPHPAIYLSKPLVPEPKFFVYPEEFEKGKAHFLKTRYPDVATESAVGEKTTHYMNCEGVPGRIYSCFPEMRFVLLLRDPVERALSNYWWSVKNGLEDLSLEEAIETESKRISAYEGKWKVVRPFSYAERGFYLTYIREYLKHFPRKNFLFLITEEFEKDPQHTADEVYQFLGVAGRKLTGPLRGNEAPRLRPAPPEVLEFLGSRFRDSNREFEAFLGRKIPCWLK